MQPIAAWTMQSAHLPTKWYLIEFLCANVTLAQAQSEAQRQAHQRALNEWQHERAILERKVRMFGALTVLHTIDS
jgi:hypothetical protein